MTDIDENKEPIKKTDRVNLSDQIRVCPNCQAKFNDLGDIVELPQPEPASPAVVPDPVPEPEKPKTYWGI